MRFGGRAAGVFICVNNGLAELRWHAMDLPSVGCRASFSSARKSRRKASLACFAPAPLRPPRLMRHIARNLHIASPPPGTWPARKAWGSFTWANQMPTCTSSLPNCISPYFRISYDARPPRSFVATPKVLFGRGLARDSGIARPTSPGRTRPSSAKREMPSPGFGAALVA